MNRLINNEIADDGWPLLALAGAITIVVSFVVLPAGCFLLGIMLWLAHILRVPRRHTPSGENFIVAPADGRVVQITNCLANSGAMPLPYETLRITIHTKLTDPQLQTSPISGCIRDNYLLPGLFANWPNIDSVHGASNSESWEDIRNLNERREITLQSEAGYNVIMVQLATKTARQLVCRLAEGKHLCIGAPLGMARLSGVTDIYAPAHALCDVVVGQRVVAAETILAKLPAQQVLGS